MKDFGGPASNGTELLPPSGILLPRIRFVRPLFTANTSKKVLKAVLYHKYTDLSFGIYNTFKRADTLRLHAFTLP